jgi:hypothetical protein
MVVAIGGGCFMMFSDENSSTGYDTARSAHDAGVKRWEESLKYEDQRLNGTKTETDEEIHADAEKLQHEQDEGIAPAGMMEREMEGK